MTDEYTEHDVFISPFAWRYGSDAMRELWSEAGKRRLWRRVWVAIARAESTVGLVSEAQIDELEEHVDDVDIARAHEIEAEIEHDLMAEVRVYAEQCPGAGGIIHLGATSMDIEDNADVLRIRDSLSLVLGSLGEVLATLAGRIDEYADTPTMAYTHLQPAEPTTLGYRFAQYGQDLLEDLRALRRLRRKLRGKGLKGATGTSASFAELLADQKQSPEELERLVMDELGLRTWAVATQTYPRKQDYTVLCTLASLAQSLSRFAFDLRVLQSPAFGEWAEPFGEMQVGSSAMPFKRNPVNAENISSMARHLAALPRVAWDNAAQGVLERTLDDSANRRSTLPEAFLMIDEMLRRTGRILGDMRIDVAAAARQIETYGTFAATERVLMAAVREGADRQDVHELIREHSLRAWTALAEGKENPLVKRLAGDPRLTRYLSADRVRALLDATHYVGDAPRRARRLAAKILRALQPDKDDRTDRI